MKVLSGIEKMELDNFPSYYLSREYEKCLSIGRRKGVNNITMHGNMLYLFISTGVK